MTDTQETKMTFHSTLTPEQQAAILNRVMTHDIAKGVGTAETACSIASINLALTGRLTDEIPACMSPVIGRWIIVVQDAMPADIRNSREWRELLPFAAGTGRDHDVERLAIMMNWMWATVLPSVQPVADAGGYGDAWLAMCEQRTVTAVTALNGTPRMAAAAAAVAEACVRPPLLTAETAVTMAAGVERRIQHSVVP